MEPESKSFKQIVKTPLIIVLSLWVIYVIEILTRLDVGYYGIYPRQILGLKGILTSPLIHGSWSHLINNSIPLFVLLCIIFYFFRRISWQIIVMVYLLTGLSVWLF
ncbi:MAG: rhomboid family intramembrane serine protease, partial [Saprospiraceae bacterium]